MSNACTLAHSRKKRLFIILLLAHLNLMKIVVAMRLPIFSSLGDMLCVDMAIRQVAARYEFDCSLRGVSFFLAGNAGSLVVLYVMWCGTIGVSVCFPFLDAVSHFLYFLSLAIFCTNIYYMYSHDYY